jgi:S-DNA-T family DNA segregation ATPase FtsK/SpoIIIE
VVELAPFDGIPHLLFPVVTDMKQAANALRWTVDEMERRYQLFADAGTRNISTYNRWIKRAPREELPEGVKRLAYIVVVVEEFADLMMTQGKEVEASVARLAQKARAAGIHVILATQRPSVDVITGMIKANFPTRIAFRVAQKVDSRTILDQQGAEHLLGSGDMLVKLGGAGDLRRVQCPFVSEDEVQRVTDMLREQGEPEYDESIVRGRDDEENESAEPGDAESDPLYDQAVRIVAETQKCSTSWIQRKLGIGYNRAAKIVETMEKLGLVGAPNGSKARDIFISPH